MEPAGSIVRTLPDGSEEITYTSGAHRPPHHRQGSRRTVKACADRLRVKEQRGVTQLLYGFPDSFTNIGSGEFAGIPYLIFYAVIVGLIFHIVLEKTVFGYNIRAVGGNRRAAAANAIRVARLDMALYAISGGVAALAGILGAARLSTASPSAGGAGFTFQVVTAVIVGGTSLFGGVGTIAGSALGAILFAELNNGLQVINVNPLYQSIFIGIILIAAVAVDQYRRGRRFRAGP